MPVVDLVTFKRRNPLVMCFGRFDSIEAGSSQRLWRLLEPLKPERLAQALPPENLVLLVHSSSQRCNFQAQSKGDQPTQDVQRPAYGSEIHVHVHEAELVLEVARFLNVPIKRLGRHQRLATSLPYIYPGSPQLGLAYSA